MGIKTTGTGFPELVKLSTLQMSDTFVDLGNHALFVVSNQSEESAADGLIYVCALTIEPGKVCFLNGDTLVMPVEVHLEVRNK